MTNETVQFKLPSPVICSCIGSSFVGKTTYLRYIIKERHKVFETKHDYIIYIYEMWQDIYNAIQKECPSIIFHRDVNVLDQYLGKGSILFFVDDKYSQLNVRGSEMHSFVEKMALMACHHKRVDLILVMHNPFFTDGAALNRSFTNLIIFPNHRDISYLSYLNRQMFPGTRLLIDAYRRSCRKYKPLVLFLNPSFDHAFISNTLLPSPETEIYMLKK